MKLNISVKEEKPHNICFSIPRWLYMNSVGISLIAMRKDVPFTPRQARKCLRAVKKVMREKHLTQLAKIEVLTSEAEVEIDL